jgi:hypothetical protein
VFHCSGQTGVLCSQARGLLDAPSHYEPVTTDHLFALAKWAIGGREFRDDLPFTRQALARAHPALGHQVINPLIKTIDGDLNILRIGSGIPTAARNDQILARMLAHHLGYLNCSALSIPQVMRCGRQRLLRTPSTV